MISSVALVGWQLGNVFRPAQVFWHCTESTYWFSTVISWLDFIWCIHVYFRYIYIYNYVFDFSILHARNFHILFCLSHWVCFILTSLTSLFQVRCLFAPLLLLLLHIIVDLPDLVIIIGGYYLDYPLNLFLLKPRIWYMFSYSFWDLVDVLF